MFLKTLLKRGILCLAIVFQICQQRSLFFQLLSCTTGLFRTIASSGNVLKTMFIKEQCIVTSKAPRAEDITGLLEISDNLTVVWEPAFPLANKEDCDELFTLRSCRHVALPFYTGPTICLLRGVVGDFRKNILQSDFEREKKWKIYLVEKVPALKKMSIY